MGLRINGRFRVKVWNADAQRWRTVYVKPDMLGYIVGQLEDFGIPVEVPTVG